MTYAKTFYLLIRIVAGGTPEGIGPMEQAECKAVQMAIEAAAVEAIRSVECKEARVFTMCPVPGFPAGSVGRACPVWTDGPFVSAPPDQK